MRRTRIGVLLAVSLGLGSLALACETVPSREATLECPGALSGAPQALEAEYPAFKRQVEAGPFYRLLTARLGSPKLCLRDVTAGALRLVYEFRDGGRLEARTDPRIGLSDQRLALHGLSQGDARTVLQETERDAFGQDGCGIPWTSSPARDRSDGSDTAELVYRGDLCNCQARMVYRQSRLVRLVFRTAC